MTVKLPRVYNKNLAFKSILHPIRVSLVLNATPLSYASVEVQKGEGLTSRDFVELFTPYGSAGFFRVTAPGDTYGNATTTSQLEHAITEVGDYLVKEEISEMMAATTAMSRIFKHYKGNKWQLGTVSALGSGQVAVDADHDSVLDAMLAILEQKPDCMMDFVFTTTPWTVRIVKKGTTVTAEGRLSRNLISARVSSDDSELCTRAYYKTYKTDAKGNVTESWTYKDADTKSTYGVVEREVSTSSDMTTAEINYAVNTYLNEHKQPKYSIEISAEELSLITGESFDKFTVGKLMRLAIPEYSVVVEKNITSVMWSDLFNAPELMTVCMGDEEDTVVSFLHKVESVTTSSGKSGTSVKKWKEYETKIDQTDKYIDMYAKRVDKAGNILEQAGLDINSKGVLVYATDTKNMVGAKLNVLSDKIETSVANAKTEFQSRISQEANRISLVVEGTGKNAKIKPASIVASINNGSSSLKFSADHIDVDGLVTKMKSVYLDTLGIEADIAEFDTMTYGTASTGGVHEVKWKTASIKHATNFSTQRNFCWGSSSSVSGAISGYIALDYETTTIHYLGY